jgi:hypothetical protein
MNPKGLRPHTPLQDGDILRYREETEEEKAQRERLVKYLTRVIILILFLVPVGYIAAIVATFIHEVLGHGLAAVLVGGSIEGIDIQWDGQGLASISHPANIPKYDLAFIFLAGILVTMVVGLILVRVGIHRGIPYFPRLAILTIAAECLMGAGPMYIFWNALFPLEGHHWDVSNLLELYDSQGLRVFLVVTSLVLMIVVMIIVNVVLYKAFGEWLNTEKDREGYQYVIPLVVLFVAHSSRWVTNTLLLNIGWWTILVMVALTLMVLSGIYYLDLEMPTYRKEIRGSYLPMIVVYFAAMIMVGLVFMFF